MRKIFHSFHRGFAVVVVLAASTAYALTQTEWNQIKEAKINELGNGPYIDISLTYSEDEIDELDAKAHTKPYYGYFGELATADEVEVFQRNARENVRQANLNSSDPTVLNTQRLKDLERRLNESGYMIDALATDIQFRRQLYDLERQGTDPDILNELREVRDGLYGTDQDLKDMLDGILATNGLGEHAAANQ